jgi:hypothetical protein
MVVVVVVVVGCLSEIEHHFYGGEVSVRNRTLILIMAECL